VTQKIKIQGNKDGNNSPVKPGSEWQPIPGEELADFLKTTGRPAEVCAHIQNESISILGGCINPVTGGSRTGLVLGRVQSGKTSSFTAVSALAHDNGFKLIVVIAGTTHLLVQQTSDRLAKDLRLTEPNAFRRWTMCTVSSKDAAQEAAGLANLRTRIVALANDPQPLFSGIPIVIVMKNKIHLDRLNKLFSDLNTIENIDLSNFPTLIIDDEAHMHSPDVGNVEDGTPSAVYESLRKLANNFPNRSILQYTATPQANLLMEIGDEMSPDFVRLIEPGPGYAGGREIFGDPQLPNPRIRRIDPKDYLENPTSTDQPPESLVNAMANFLLMCSIDFKISGVANSRSMLVHSDVKMKVHAVFEHWLKTLRDSWKELLSDQESPIPEVFEKEIADIVSKDVSLSAQNLLLDDLRSILVQVLNNLNIQSVNSKNDVGKVNFNLAPYWIINGGNILGVGYTVEGLITTHMMRKPGGGMADTIQQRGRFFGYLNERFSQVRVFITDAMAKRFTDYVEHEEGLRNSLSRYDSSDPNYDVINKPTLKEWKRVFWLDPSMIPTRKKAQRLMLERAQIDKDGWLRQKKLLGASGADQQNLQIVHKLVEDIKNDPNRAWNKSDVWGGADDAVSTTHLESLMTLHELKQLISNLNFSAEDEGDVNSALLAIEENAADPDNDLIRIFLMSRGVDNQHTRARTVPDGGTIDLFQGRGSGRGAYVGDKKVVDPLRPSLQIHFLDIYPTKNHAGNPARSSVPVIALHLPKKTHDWAKNLLKQV
jgi:hypothetical protein